jgi:hypothetical protein
MHVQFAPVSALTACLLALMLAPLPMYSAYSLSFPS